MSVGAKSRISPLNISASHDFALHAAELEFPTTFTISMFLVLHLDIFLFCGCCGCGDTTLMKRLELML